MKAIVTIIGWLLTLSAMAQTAAIPDANLLSFLKSKYSQTITSNNQLDINKASQVTGTLDCSGKNISNLEGIQYFTGITSLDAASNNLTSAAPVSGLVGLKTLHLEDNLLTSLPSLSGLVNLQLLIIHTNQLTALPDLSANTQLTQLIVHNNKLTALPDLSALANLTKVDAGNNLLTVTPDFRANLELTAVSIDRNYLTSAPDLSKQTKLTLYQAHLNNLTFDDLIPYLSYSNFSSFELTPQKNIPQSNKDFAVNDSLILSTNLDRSVSGIGYQWYFKNQSISSVANDSLIIYPATGTNEGYYYCVLSHPSFPADAIRTDSFYVRAIICPSAANFSFEYSKVSCLKEGQLKITVLSLPSQAYNFTLTSAATGRNRTSTSGLFKNLNEPQYILNVKTGASCNLTLPDPIVLPYDECKETFITPDGDNDRDTYYFTEKGKAIIYDKNGRMVQTLSLPAEWDGSGMGGKIVSPGYYVADINDGEEFVRISVLY